MNLTEKSDVNNIETNIVVIGSGGGGLAAALSAAEEGGKGIIVLEKEEFLGGNSGLSRGPHGLFAVESPVQKRENIPAYADDYFKIAMEWSHWKTNPRIVRTFIDKSADTIEWLEKMGMEFDCVPFYPNPVSTRHIPKGEWLESGANLIKVLSDECRKLGVQILTQTPAKKILTGTNNEITGVLAEKNGKEFEIKTNSVIIATGGFSGNQELLKKYCPDYRDGMVLDALPQNGDGLIMATSIGAATEGLGTLHLIGPVADTAVPLQIATFPDKLPVLLVAIVTLPFMLWVNKRGQRFADENVGKYHFESCNVAVQQPDNVTYALFDSNMAQIISKEGVQRFVPDEAQGKEILDLEEGLRSQMDNGLVKTADSLDEMADWIGAEHSAIKATIDEYNTYCDQGHDAFFVKDPSYLIPLRTPPYYAIKCEVLFAGTIGGIKINEHMEVVNKQDNPIPGLYAVGVDTGGWESNSYCPVLSGSALGFAVNGGRIAGRNAVQLIRKKKK